MCVYPLREAFHRARQREAAEVLLPAAWSVGSPGKEAAFAAEGLHPRPLRSSIRSPAKGPDLLLRALPQGRLVRQPFRSQGTVTAILKTWPGRQPQESRVIGLTLH